MAGKLMIGPETFGLSWDGFGINVLDVQGYRPRVCTMRPRLDEPENMKAGVACNPDENKGREAQARALMALFEKAPDLLRALVDVVLLTKAIMVGEGLDSSDWTVDALDTAEALIEECGGFIDAFPLPDTSDLTPPGT